MKKGLKPIISAVSLFGAFCCFGFLINFIKSFTQQSGFPYRDYIIYFFASVLFGSLLGLSSINKQRQNKGKWKFNYIRFIYLGIPSLIVGSFVIIYYYINIRVLLDLTNALSPFLSDSMIQKMGLILFGFIFITSFYKDTSKAR